MKIPNNHGRIIDSMHIVPSRRHRWDYRWDDHARAEKARLTAEAFMRDWRAKLASQSSQRP